MKVLVGLILFCLLLALATFLHKPLLGKYIENDLLGKSHAIIEEAGHDPDGISYNGHALDIPAALAGKLSPEVYKELERVHGAYIPEPSDIKGAGKAPVIAVVPEKVTPEPVVTYEDLDFRAERKDGKIIATGLLPNKGTQDNLITMLKRNKAGLEVVDKTTLTDNPSPKNWWKGKPTKFIPNFFNGSKGPAFVHYLPDAFKSSAEFSAEAPYNNAMSLASGFPDDVKKETQFVYNKPAVVVPVEPAALVLKDPEFFMTEGKDGSLVIRGTVDSDATKSALVSAVKASIPANEKISVIDNLNVLPKISPITNLPKVQKLLTSHIQEADQAEMDYTPSTLALRGIVDETANEVALVSLAKPAVSDARLLNNELKIIPRESLDFRAERKEDKIILTGLLPSKKVQSELVSLTKASSAGLEVIDQTTLSERPVLNRWWNDHPKSALSEIFPKSVGPAFIHYKQGSLAAQADYPVKADHGKAKGRFSTVVQGVNKSINLTHTPKAAPVAAVDLEKDLNLLPVYFGTSSDYINAKEAVKIKKAADAILKSSDKKTGLTVGGYADQRGNPEFNKTLSLKRANAVRKKLVSLGVNPDRLVVNHFGEDTSNMAKSDLWKARRVSISLTPIN